MKQATFRQIGTMILILTTVLLGVFVIDGQTNQASANIAHITSCDQGAVAQIAQAANRATGCFIDEQCSQAVPSGSFCPPGFRTESNGGSLTCIPHRATRWEALPIGACPQKLHCCMQVGGPGLEEITEAENQPSEPQTTDTAPPQSEEATTTSAIVCVNKGSDKGCKQKSVGHTFTRTSSAWKFWDRSETAYVCELRESSETTCQATKLIT